MTCVHAVLLRSWSKRTALRRRIVRASSCGCVIAHSSGEGSAHHFLVRSRVLECTPAQNAGDIAHHHQKLRCQQSLVVAGHGGAIPSQYFLPFTCCLWYLLPLSEFGARLGSLCEEGALKALPRHDAAGSTQFECRPLLLYAPPRTFVVQHL